MVTLSRRVFVRGLQRVLTSTLVLYLVVPFFLAWIGLLGKVDTKSGERLLVCQSSVTLHKVLSHIYAPIHWFCPAIRFADPEEISSLGI